MELKVDTLFTSFDEPFIVDFEGIHYMELKGQELLQPLDLPEHLNPLHGVERGKAKHLFLQGSYIKNPLHGVERSLALKLL